MRKKRPSLTHTHIRPTTCEKAAFRCRRQYNDDTHDIIRWADSAAFDDDRLRRLETPQQVTVNKRSIHARTTGCVQLEPEIHPSTGLGIASTATRRRPTDRVASSSSLPHQKPHRLVYHHRYRTAIIMCARDKFSVQNARVIIFIPPFFAAYYLYYT